MTTTRPYRKLDVLLFAVIAACALVLWLAGCDREPVNGLVTAKRFRPAHVQLVMMPVSTGRTTTLVPVNIYHPDRWILAVEEYDESGRPYRVRDVYVKRDVYEHLQEGVWFVEEPELIDEEPTRKVRQ